jgi:hypothetical protein
MLLAQVVAQSGVSESRRLFLQRASLDYAVNSLSNE